MATQGSSNTQPERYCSDIAMEAIHYAGDNIWTPNNIKRFIVSPDAVVVQLFTSPKPIIKRFRPDLYSQCICSPKYKRMISVLGGSSSLVCSHVEEVIYCLRGEQGGYLHESEVQVSAILSRNKQFVNKDALVSEIGNRFKRLYSITMYNGTVGSLIGKYGNKMIKDFEFFVADQEDAQANYIHKEDWYKGTYFRPANYQADAPNGKLASIISKEMTAIESRLKKESIDKMKNKDWENVKSVLEKELVTFRGIFVLYFYILNLIKRGERSQYPSYLFSSALKSTKLQLIRGNSLGVLHEPENIFARGDKKAFNVLGIEFVEDKDHTNSSEYGKQAIAILHKASILMFSATTVFYTEMIKELAAAYPFTVVEILKHLPKKLRLPDNSMKELNELGIFYDKASVNETIENIDCHIRALFSDGDFNFDEYSRTHKKMLFGDSNPLSRGKF